MATIEEGQTPDPCQVCGKTGCVDYRVVEDDEGHEDVEYHCNACGNVWWIDGPDY